MFSSTIKPYKFVNPSSISAGGGGATIIAGGKKITGGMTPQIKSARVTMLAINRIGMAMEGLGKTQQQIRDIIVYENKYLTKSSDFKKKREGYRRDQKSEAKSESFGKKQKDDVAKEVVKKEKKQLSWLEKIFGPFVGIISFVGRFVIGQTVLRWMADPKNTDKLTVFVKSFGKVFKWAYNIAYKSTDAVLTGFAKVFGSSDKKGLDRFGEVLGGLGQLLIGIAGFKALGYLLKPWSLVTDILDLVDLLGSGDKSVDLPDGGKPTGGKPDPKLKGSQERYFKKYGRDAFIKRFGEEGLKNLPRNMQRTALKQFGRNAKAFGIRTTQKVLGKGVSKALGKIPIIGPVIDFAIRTLIFKEPLGKAAASAVGAGIGQGIGGAIGTAGAAALAGGTFGVGLAAAPIIIGASSLIGGFVGDYIGSKLYDWIAPFFSKDKTPQMAKGGIVTKPTKAIIGEKGPEVVIPLSKLGGFGVAATIIGATHSALSRMGAAGEIAKSLIGADLNAAESIFGSSKVGGGDSLGKSVMKASKASSTEIDAGNDISILIGQESITIKDRKDPSNKPTTLRGQLANILGALIWVSKQNISGGGTGSPGPAGKGTDTSGDFTGSANAEKAFNYLKSKGLTAEQAAGLVGNFMQEAGHKIDPKITNSIGHKGIAQWDPRDRWPKLVNFAKSKSLNPETLEAQLQFVWHELDTGDGGLSLRTLKGAKTVQQAAHLFVKNYERSGEEPGHPGYDNRIKYGNQVYSKYAKMAQGGAVADWNKKHAPTGHQNILTASYKEAKQPKETWSKFASGGKLSNGQLPESELVSVGSGHKLHKSIAPQFKAMQEAAKKDGYPFGSALKINSSYRSYQRQKELYASLGAGTAAFPGTSNHGLGLAVDLWYTDGAYKWLRKNASSFGFRQIPGYESNNPNAHEAWHWENVSGKGSIDGGTPTKPTGGTDGENNQQQQEEPETIESVFAKLESAIAGLNTSLGYTPVAKPTTPSAKPTTPSAKPTPAASSSGSQMSKASEEAARLEEAAAAVQGSAQIVPMPINTSVNVPAAFSGQQVYYPRSPITYGI